MKRICVSAAMAALFAYAAAGQDATDLQKMAAEKEVKAKLEIALTKAQIVGLEGGITSNIKGAPYSAEQITENTQTLGDGTRIHHETSVKLYRDSEGRTRRETPEMVTIFDPVAGVGYTLNPKTMTGGKMQVSVSQNGPGANYVYRSTSAAGAEAKSVQVFSYSTDSGEAMTKTVTESPRGYGFGVGGSVAVAGMLTKAKTEMRGNVETLQAKTMEGVNVRGERRTNTIDIGAIGNDRPIDVVDERWYSPDLQLNVMSRHTDPRTGDEMVRLINISRSNPDSSLFQPPAGYEISEGKNFPVTFKRDQ